VDGAPILSFSIRNPSGQVCAIPRCTRSYQGSQWAAFRLFRLCPTSLLCFEQSLAAQDKAPSTGSEKNGPPVAGSSSQKPVPQVPPAVHRPPGLASALRRSLPNPVASTSSAPRSHSTERSTWTTKHSLGPDTSPRPSKRVRTDGDNTPSLLSRLGSSASNGTEYRQGAADQRSLSAAEDSVQVPRGGYSIKGAAKASNEPLHRIDAPSSSLLDRITRGGGPGGGSGRSDDDRARRKW
jgi:hypothetical protein